MILFFYLNMMWSCSLFTHLLVNTFPSPYLEGFLLLLQEVLSFIMKAPTSESKGIREWEQYVTVKEKVIEEKQRVERNSWINAELTLLASVGQEIIFALTY